MATCWPATVTRQECTTDFMADKAPQAASTAHYFCGAGPAALIASRACLSCSARLLIPCTSSFARARSALCTACQCCSHLALQVSP